MTTRDELVDLRKQVQFLRDGADHAYKRMLNQDGSESVYAPEHRHFREAYDSVLGIIDGSSDE